jgi:hypothetical protein
VCLYACYVYVASRGMMVKLWAVIACIYVSKKNPLETKAAHKKTIPKQKKVLSQKPKNPKVFCFFSGGHAGNIRQRNIHAS